MMHTLLARNCLVTGRCYEPWIHITRVSTYHPKADSPDLVATLSKLNKKLSFVADRKIS